MSLYDRFIKLPKEVQEHILLDVRAIPASELEDRYDGMLDECFGPVTIGGLQYDHALALSRVDPIAYCQGFRDYFASEEDLLEIDGFYYNAPDLEEALETYLTTIEV